MLEGSKMNSFHISSLPVAIVGGGPIGLAAAAHLVERGVSVKLYESGATIASSVASWGHVRLFSPWRYNIDDAARTILQRNGWTSPSADELPTGRDLVDSYLKPLANTPELQAVIETGALVKAVARQGIDKVVGRHRELRPFELS